MRDVVSQARDAKQAWHTVRLASSDAKNLFLKNLERLLRNCTSELLDANKKDLSESDADLSPAMRQRLALTEKNIAVIADGVRDIQELPDPVGTIAHSWTRDDGLRIERVRVPIGVIFFIFESRPNVVIDVAALCIKSGNTVILRPGKEAMHSSAYMLRLINEALEHARLPHNAVQQLEDRSYDAMNTLVTLSQYVDLVIPRGRESLITAVREHARVPVIAHARGLCHAYIDEYADPSKAIAIALNAKTSNPSTCNSIETILVHKDCADRIMPELLTALRAKNVEIRGCPKTCGYNAECIAATTKDWATEYLDLIVSVKIVDSFNEALQHIAQYSSGLTDSIVTENKENAALFLKAVDSATALVNASNRLTDGAQFGLGAEIGISTARIHMRGPMGLSDLTVQAYNVIGDGHLRN